MTVKHIYLKVFENQCTLRRGGREGWCQTHEGSTEGSRGRQNNHTILTSEAASNLNIFWVYQKNIDAGVVICFREEQEEEEEDLYQTQPHSFQQMDSCLLGSTYWVLGSVLTRVSKNMWAPQGGSSLTISVNTHPKGIKLRGGGEK